MKLRAILFDIDDTLFATTDFAGHARRHAVEAMVQEGLEVDADIAYRELLDVVEEFSSNYGRHFDKLVVRLGAYLRPGIHPAVVIASGVRAYHETKARIEPFPDALRVLDLLTRTDLVRGVLTNGLTVKQADKLVRLGLQNAFSPDAIFISEEMGVAKPHPRIFQLACERLGLPPAKTLYVGDSPRTDIDPAHDAGLWTCLRRGRGKHAGYEGRHEANYVVDQLDELVPILREKFSVEFEAPPHSREGADVGS